MPSLLITTSRRTSNRVRSFAHDLTSVLPGSERFNRGGMGLTELISRIRQSGAQAALVISIWRGNPGELTILAPDGEEILKLRLESALLRREIDSSNTGRVGSIEGVGVKIGSSESVRDLAGSFAELLSLNIEELSDPSERRTEKNRTLLWFEDAPSEKILWTHYNTKDLSELGPRIRVSSVRRSSEDGSE
ncbi:MAG: Brix domain-containing protein [Candidatus Thorarchaeota archaeon]|nr:Brix domain-containing protein [Candidatus Thorarchaeota archaeon]